MTAEDEVARALAGLWPSAALGPLRELLPRDLPSLRDFYGRLQQFVESAPRALEGTIDPAAIVRGEIISMGPDSVIEAGAIVHESCRLILGPGSRVRAGSLLRDEVVTGADCLIGSHCDIARSVLLGPGTALGHSIVFNDGIAGAHALLSAFIGAGNTHLTPGREIVIRTRAGRAATGRTYLGALLGDGVRIGSNATLSPGTIVLPGLTIPPAAALLGIIDAARRERLFRGFFAQWEDQP
jgi:acetyltransferase-like isoleucine patch superfamily enzyme